MQVATDFFTTESQRIAELCRAMASRFGAGGRLLATGELSDVRHVTVEFVHPVIVGKRALPALGVIDGMELIAEPDDMVIGFGPQAASAVAVARERGCLVLDLA